MLLLQTFHVRIRTRVHVRGPHTGHPHCHDSQAIGQKRYNPGGRKDKHTNDCQANTYARYKSAPSVIGRNFLERHNHSWGYLFNPIMPAYVTATTYCIALGSWPQNIQVITGSPSYATAVFVPSHQLMGGVATGKKEGDVWRGL